MPHFFISYAKKDTRQLAIELMNALNAVGHGISAWADTSLRAGRSWAIQIQAEIDKCDYMIVLYSPDLNRHKQGEEESFVLTEIAYAKYTAKKSIIPVMVQKTDPPIDLTTYHYIDYTISGLQLSDLVGAICEEIDFTPPSIVDVNPPLKTDEEYYHYFMGASTQVMPPVQKNKPSIDQASDMTRQILGEPFEWCAIPEGQTKLIETNDQSYFGRQGESKVFSVPAFWMAKYCITNSQYAKFVQAGGYKDKSWWSEAGWEARNKGWVLGNGAYFIEGDKIWEEPRSWRDPRFNGANQPVVGISWYEAIAFCNWLRTKYSNMLQAITLPTEQQWQRAAQGNDGRLYPWGENFDSQKTNSVEAHINQTTSVLDYPESQSPYGVMNMAGNVWEWCLTNYDTGATNGEGGGVRVFRGGSWRVDKNHARVTCRNYRDAFGFFDSVGFRVCNVMI